MGSNNPAEVGASASIRIPVGFRTIASGALLGADPFLAVKANVRSALPFELLKVNVAVPLPPGTTVTCS